MVKANNTLIPVNAKPGDEFPKNQEYIKAEMRSHLRDCKGRAADWQLMVKYYLSYPEMRFIDIPDISLKSSTTAIGEAGEVEKPKGRLIPGGVAYESARERFLEQLKEEQKK